MKKPIKFNEAFFPAGTIVKYQVFSNEAEREVEISYLIQNFGGQFLFVIKDEICELTKSPQAIHIDHITSIVKRGSGGLVIKEPGPVGKHTLIYDEVCSHSRTKVASWSIRSYMISLFQQINISGLIDTDKFIDAFFVQNARNRRNAFAIQLYSKKRVKRWTLQNVNRYISSKKDMHRFERRMSEIDEWREQEINNPIFEFKDLFGPLINKEGQANTDASAYDTTYLGVINFNEAVKRCFQKQPVYHVAIGEKRDIGYFTDNEKFGIAAINELEKPYFIKRVTDVDNYEPIKLIHSNVCLLAYFDYISENDDNESADFANASSPDYMNLFNFDADDTFPDSMMPIGTKDQDRP